MTPVEELDMLFKYLSLLQEGKVRPNNKESSPHCCNVRDSKDNIPDITTVKDRIAVLLKLDLTKLEKSK